MNTKDVKQALQNANLALTEIVNNSNVSVKKIGMLIRLKRELQKIIDSDFQIINDIQKELEFDVNNGFTN